MALISVPCSPPPPNMAFPIPPNIAGLGSWLDDIPVYDVSGNPVPANPTPAPFDWAAWTANLIGGAAKTTENILTQQNLAKGVYTQTGPGGQQITYVQPAGTSANIFGASSTGISGTGTANSGMWMLLIAGAALLVLMMGRK